MQSIENVGDATLTSLAGAMALFYAAIPRVLGGRRPMPSGGYSRG